MNGMIKAKLQQIVSSLYTDMKYDQKDILNSTMFEKTVNIQWCVSKVFQYMYSSRGGKMLGEEDKEKDLSYAFSLFL